MNIVYVLLVFVCNVRNATMRNVGNTMLVIVNET